MTQFVEIIRGLTWIVYHLGFVNEAGVRKVKARIILQADLEKYPTEHECREFLDKFTSSMANEDDEGNPIEFVTVCEPFVSGTVESDDTSKQWRDYWNAIDAAIQSGRENGCGVGILPSIFEEVELSPDMVDADIWVRVNQDGDDFFSADDDDDCFDEDSDVFFDNEEHNGQTVDISDGLVEQTEPEPANV